ncbi:hypothetical protein CJ195_22240 [Bacillus sp. UMB0899]|nr:hypothetical protein CJ195_22240 [Bacillus sp. UMB0899]
MLGCSRTSLREALRVLEAEGIVIAKPGGGRYVQNVDHRLVMEYSFDEHAIHFLYGERPYYFGIVPILAETASQIGINKLEIAQASLLGQPLYLLSPLVGSVYVLIGFVGINFRDHIKFSTKYAVGSALVMIVVGIITGALSI